MSRSHNKHLSGCSGSRWPAVLCLLAYLAGGAGVLPSLFLMIASKDGTHTPLVGGTPDQFKLVLHHRTLCGSGLVTELGTKAPHQHGLAAKTLCLLSTQSPFDPDHRVELAPSSPTEPTGERAISPPLWEVQSVSFPSLELSSWQTAREPVWFPFAHGPPTKAHGSALPPTWTSNRSHPAGGCHRRARSVEFPAPVSRLRCRSPGRGRRSLLRERAILAPCLPKRPTSS